MSTDGAGRPPTPINLDLPFRGRWITRNSPADRVPSHGTSLFATAYSIDLVPVDDRGRTAPIGLSTLVGPEAAGRFPGFGRTLLAPVDGVVVAVHDGLPDHPAYRGLPSIGYALTQRSRMRGGWVALAGNHVLIDAGDAVVALCHLRRGSVTVGRGRRVRAGEPIGQCGNSGNSVEPHLHLQAMTDHRVEHAHPVRLTLRGSLPRNGEIIDAG